MFRSTAHWSTSSKDSRVGHMLGILMSTGASKWTHYTPTKAMGRGISQPTLEFFRGSVPRNASTRAWPDCTRVAEMSESTFLSRFPAIKSPPLLAEKCCTSCEDSQVLHGSQSAPPQGFACSTTRLGG